MLEGGGPSAGNRENNRSRGSGSLKTTLIFAFLFAGKNADNQFSGKRTGCRRVRSRVVAPQNPKTPFFCNLINYFFKLILFLK